MTGHESPHAGVALLRKAVAFEAGMWRSLFRWAARRPVTDHPDDVPFSYVKAVAAAIWIWIAASAVEMVAAHLLVPWATVRVILLVVSLWGLAWMVGYLASLTIHPHVVEEHGLRVRNGITTDLLIPWAAIRGLTTGLAATSGSRAIDVAATARGQQLRVGVSGQTNVHLQLTAPTPLRTPKGDVDPIAVSLWADDPRGLTAAVLAALAGNAATVTPDAAPR
jgi:hypothetical protein